MGNGVDDPVNHHFVSQGYQRNFATADRRLTVFDAMSGAVVHRRRAVRRNFVIGEFNTFYELDGKADRQLEREFSKIESGALHTARTIAVNNSGPDSRKAAAELFAIHLIRSPAHRRFQDRVHARDRGELLADAVAHALARSEPGDPDADQDHLVVRVDAAVLVTLPPLTSRGGLRRVARDTR